MPDIQPTPPDPAHLTVLPPVMPVSYTYYRRIKKQPTVHLARRLAIAPMLRASWSIEGPDALDATVALAQRTIKALRGVFMSHVTRALYDYGSASMEQYLAVPGPARHAAGPPDLVLKPLLNDLVNVLVDPSGAFAGLKVARAAPGLGHGTLSYSAHHTLLPVTSSVFIGLDPEAGQFYGTGALEIARETYADWKEANLTASRYDRKVAGTFLQLTYVAGSTVGKDGVRVDNAELAQTYLEAFETGCSVAVPIDRSAFLGAATESLPPDFKLEFLSDASSRQGAFVERMRYLDSMLVRAFGLPERAILEGQFGTKAEAEAHTNLALVAMESTHEFLTEEFATQILHPYLTLMLGRAAADTVTLTAGPINPEHTLWKRSLVEKMVIIKPETVDVDALFDEVGLPKVDVIINPLTPDLKEIDKEWLMKSNLLTR